MCATSLVSCVVGEDGVLRCVSEHPENLAHVLVGVHAPIRSVNDGLSDSRGGHGVSKWFDAGAHRLVFEFAVVEDVDDCVPVERFVPTGQFV
jgi:hypothetical protein